MISPRKIHEWIIKALEEPFFQAEMHRVEMSLPDKKDPQLQLVDGGKRSKTSGRSHRIEGVKRLAAR